MGHRLRCDLERVRRAIEGQDVDPRPAAYASAQVFLDDLLLIRDSLVAHGEAEVAAQDLQGLILLVRTYGSTSCNWTCCRSRPGTRRRCGHPGLGLGLHEAQKRIIALADAQDLPCRLFHGRGGRSRLFGHSSPAAGMVRGETRFPEQGGMAFCRHNNLETATHELTLGVSGLILASARLPGRVVPDQAAAPGIVAEQVRLGETLYHLLTERTAGFLDYFHEATPVREIGLMHIGSRPSHHRMEARSKGSVRAIAWVCASAPGCPMRRWPWRRWIWAWRKNVRGGARTRKRPGGYSPSPRLNSCAPVARS